MNYIGSKNRLAAFIIRTMRQVCVEDWSNLTFAEIFGGTGIVARQLKNQVKTVILNDIEPYSFVLGRNYVGNTHPIENIADKKQMLENLPLVQDGFIFQHYCLGSGSGRQYFSDENGKRIDTIRQTIQHWYNTNSINENEYYFWLASLIESADAVANTASVYGAFLKKLKKTAQKKFILQPAFFENSTHFHQVFNADANALIEKIKGDILYLDPPYNTRQYGANYHVLNTIALYDNFVPQGKTGLRPCYHRSDYCSKTKVAVAFEQLIAKADFKYIFVSYNNEGLLPPQALQACLQQYGQYSCYTQHYQRFKADTDQKRQHKAQHTIEYLHVLQK
jgi:adenine-specific DNA-methyltransferase